MSDTADTATYRPVSTRASVTELPCCTDKGENVDNAARAYSRAKRQYHPVHWLVADPKPAAKPSSQ